MLLRAAVLQPTALCNEGGFSVTVCCVQHCNRVLITQCQRRSIRCNVVQPDNLSCLAAWCNTVQVLSALKSVSSSLKPKGTTYGRYCWSPITFGIGVLLLPITHC